MRDRPKTPRRPADRLRAWAAALLLSLSPAAARAGAVDEAEAALHRGAIGVALRTLTGHLQANPGDVPAQELYIDILANVGQSEAVRRDRAAWAEAHAADPDAWYLLGRAELSADAAEAAYRRALGLRPGHARAQMGLGAVLLSKGATTSAAEAYQAAVAADPGLAEAWTGLVRAWIVAGDRAAAEGVARRAVAAVPDDAGTWLALATLSPRDAPTLLTQAASRIPDDPQLQVALARALFSAAAWDRAEAAYDRALSLITEGDAQLQVERAMISELRGGRLSMDGASALLEIRPIAAQAPEEALVVLDQVIRTNPESGWARLVRGNVRAGMGRVQDAERDLRGAMVALPASPEVWGALGAFYLAQRRADEALPLLQKAASARPTDPGPAVATAVAMAQTGDVTGALARLDDARRRFPGNVGPVLATARVLLSHGQADAAFELLAGALRINPDMNLAAALVSAAQEIGQPARALQIMDALAAETGDPRFARAAAGLRAAPAPRPAPAPAD